MTGKVGVEIDGWKERPWKDLVKHGRVYVCMNVTKVSAILQPSVASRRNFGQVN